MMVRLISKKSMGRIQLILLGSISQLSVSLTNMVVALLVVRLVSVEFWGSAVYFIILLDLAFSLISWGNRPYLIREFSLSPNRVPEIFHRSLVYRSWLLILGTGGVFLLDQPLPITIGLEIWLVARYIHQSFEPVIQFHRHFVFSLLQEAAAALILVVSILAIGSQLTLPLLIFLMAAGVGSKAVSEMIYYRSIFWVRQPVSLKEARKFLAISFPFLLLTLTGLMQSRMDLYVVALSLDNTHLGQYQVLVALLGFSQMIASFLLTPFAPHILRLNSRSLAKLNRAYILTGSLLTVLAIGLAYFLLTYFYHIIFCTTTYLLAYLYVFLFYLYALRHYELARLNLQKVAAWFAFGGSVVNLTMCLILTPLFGLEGALIAVVISKIGLAIAYNRRSVIEFLNRSRSIRTTLSNKDRGG